MLTSIEKLPYLCGEVEMIFLSCEMSSKSSKKDSSKEEEKKLSAVIIGEEYGFRLKQLAGKNSFVSLPFQISLQSFRNFLDDSITFIG